ncbi:MAG TPA: hypothetical protein PLO62_07975 [Candidatus Hydrogenedentes bacterium]|nr:hypothetical protein [Candidatus Hydrogenedentota bacterium]HOS04120.1 hypothetical protein [Candidatus Hydrogenedentota bacterium]
MRNSRNSRGALWGIAAICTVSLLITGCGKKEEQQAQPSAPAAPATTQAVAPSAPPAPVVAPVVRALQCMPEQAALALAAPSLDAFYGKAVALAKRVVPEGIPVEEAIAQYSQIMAAHLGVPSASTPVDVMKAGGLDANAPVAVFVELDTMHQALGDFAVQMRAAASAGEDSVGSSAPPAPIKPPQPGMAILFTASDPVKADAFVTKFIAAASDVPAEIKTEQDGDIALTFVKADGPAYFVSGSTFVFGNSRALLKAVAARMRTPADVRYGSDACPINDPAEIAMLLRMDTLLNIAAGLSTTAAMLDSGVAEAARTQMKAMNDLLKSYAGADPMVVTWNVRQDGMDLLARIDTETHTALPAMLGDAAPLTLSNLYPAALDLFVDMRLTPEAKAQLERTWKNSLSVPVQDDPRAKQTLSLLRLALALTGEELALGVTGQRDGLPLLLALIEQDDVEKTKSVLAEIGIASKSLETYNEVELMELPIPVTPAIRYGFIGDTLAFSNDIAALKGAIDRKVATQEQTYLASLRPPLDAATPRYMAAVLRGSLFTHVFAPMALRDNQEANPEASATLAVVGAKLRDVRLLQERRGSWLEQRLSIQLN